MPSVYHRDQHSYKRNLIEPDRKSLGRHIRNPHFFHSVFGVSSVPGFRGTITESPESMGL